MVPDSCCKTVVPGCGRRDHASNIYKVEVGRWGLLSGLGCWVAPSPRRLEDSPPSAAPPPLQGGCITKLETFIQEHLRIIGAVGLGIACVQVCVCGGVLGMARVHRSQRIDTWKLARAASEKPDASLTVLASRHNKTSSSVASTSACSPLPSKPHTQHSPFKK